MPVTPGAFFAREGLHVLAVGREAVHERLPVAIRDPDVA